MGNRWSLSSRWTRSVATGFLLGLVSVSVSVAMAQGEVRSVNTGVYTDAQARRGEAAFDAHCGSCHEPDRFKGAAFVDNWQGPLDNLFTSIRKSMPEDNPGGLPPQSYADVIAYLLSLNGYAAGPERLEGTIEAMRGVTLESARATRVTP